MVSSSSLITSIHSALKKINTKGCGPDIYNMKIGLRNLKVLLLCLRQVDDDDYDVHLTCLFSRIKRFIEGLILVNEIRSDGDIVSEIHSLVKEVDDELSYGMNVASSPLAVDEMVAIADSILDSTPHSVHRPRYIPIRKSTKAFAVEMRFKKSFLCFAMRANVELQNLLIQIQPVTTNAARVFVKQDADDDVLCWCEDAESNCSTTKNMATDPQVYQAYTQAQAQATSKFGLTLSQDAHTNTFKNFLDSLVSLLWDLLRGHSDSWIKDQYKVLYERLRFSRATLKHRPMSFDEELWDQVVVLACDAGVLICSLHQADHVARLSDLLQRFDAFQAQVELANNASKPGNDDQMVWGDSTSNKIRDDSENDLKIQKEITPMLSNRSQLVGFQNDEVTLVLDRLTRGSKQLRIVPISGMAGLGKTTFALKLYNHPSVMHYFHARAWCAISQVMDKKKALVQLLNQIHGSESHSDLTEEDSANNLRRSLKGKRYLILLDDVWTPDVWNSLQASFPNDATNSRIMLTSRRLDIAPHARPDEQPHLLRLREDSECFDILQTKLSHKEGWNSDLGMKIAIMSKGLPLTVVILAGILATTEKEGWKGILDHFSSGGVSGGAESALELSYKHLPDYLQPCFLYFGAFPEDEKVSVKRLIRLWMAEEFVRITSLKRIEDVAKEHLEELIERSLVMVVENRSIGGAKTCQIHDLLHDFCLIKAKQENFFHVLLQVNDQLSDFNEPCNLGRLSIQSFSKHFKKSELFCPRARSILFFSAGKRWSDSYLNDMTFIIQIFKLLKVLDIYQIYLINGIPNEIELLTLLRYLSIQSDVAAIPSSVGNLSNLETFIAGFRLYGAISFPHWNQQKLKYLHVKSSSDGFTLPTENSSTLLELETLRGIIFYSDDGSMEKQMRKFPNIRRLKCVLVFRSYTRDYLHNMVVPDFLSQLESLSIRGSYKLKFTFGSSGENLRKVTLQGFELLREEIRVIGKLPSLEVLILHEIQFPENELEMNEGEFAKVRYLKLEDNYHNSTLRRWGASDEQLPCLQKLVFKFCSKLIEIPSTCLETSSTLEEIQVVGHPSTLESLVRDIEEVQKDFGNSIKVHVISL